jgi:hypothetical protein
VCVLVSIVPTVVSINAVIFKPTGLSVTIYYNSMKQTAFGYAAVSIT